VCTAKMGERCLIEEGVPGVHWGVGAHLKPEVLKRGEA